MGKPVREFEYYTNCTICTDVKALQDMVDNDLEITYKTLIKHISVKHLREVFTQYKGSPLWIDKDWSVTFYRSKFKRQRCYYVRWSSIEFIFLKRK